MKRKAIVLMLVIGLLICTIGCDGLRPISKVSFTEIITYPERYDGVELSVFGVLKKEEEGYCLYNSIYTAKYTYPIDGIWLGDLGKVANEGKLNEWNLWFVQVTGILDLEEKGPNGSYSSGIHVSRIEEPRVSDEKKKQYDYYRHPDVLD